LWGGLQIYELDAGAGFPEQFHQQQVLTIKSVLRVFCLEQFHQQQVLTIKSVLRVFCLAFLKER